MSMQYKNKFIPILFQIEDDFKNNNFDAVNATLKMYAQQQGFDEALIEYMGDKTSFKQLFLPPGDELLLQRQCILLSHVSPFNACKIMHYQFALHVAHFKAIVSSDRYINGGYHKTHDVLLKSKTTQSFINMCFVTEKFDELQQMQQLFGKKILDNPDGESNICIEVKEKGNNYTTHIYTSDIEYCPYHNIIYNYSESKKQYLTSQGINLPSIDEATNLTHNIAIRYPTLIYLHQMTSALKYYHTCMLYNEMQDNLPVNKQTTKKAKI